MRGKGRGKWRPLWGAAAIGLVVGSVTFLNAWAAPEGSAVVAPAGIDKSQPSAAPSVTTPPIAAGRTTAVQASAQVAGPTVMQKALAAPLARDARVRMGRIVTASPVADAPTAGGSVLAATMVPGQPCDCDSDCVPALPCRVGRCRKETAGQLQAGTCEELIAPVDTRCDLDALFCTDDRCILSPGGAKQCVNGTNNGNTCTTAGDCPGGTCEVITVCTNGAVTRCATECNGGTNAGDDCLRDSDCGGGTCILQAAPGQAVCNETLDRCEVHQGGGAVGRCCSTDGTTCSYVTEASCTGSGGKWLRTEDPDDILDECVCPKYGSAISPAGAYGTTVGPIRISEKVCAIGGDICEDATFCQKRCTGPAPFEICEVDTDCPTNETCQPDTCVADTPPRCADGFYKIGDDYTLPNASYLRLKQFRFRGGVDKPDEVLIFEFYEQQGHCSNAPATACDSFVLASCPGGSCIPDLVDAVGIRFGNGGIFDYLIDVDCANDCIVAEEEAPQDEPIIIPPAGWVAIRSSRTEPTADARNAANGRWLSAAAEGGNEVDFGSNNPNLMWVNAAPTGTGPVTPQIMVFELLGDKLPSSGACCDATNGNCTDTQKWDCRTCSATGAPCRYYPEPLRDFINCGFNDFCVEDNWFGPKTHVDFNTGGGLDCADSPCDLGACCFPNGTCQRLDQQLCTGDFQGFGTDCTPNCCTQTFTGGDCCETLFYCDDGSGDCAAGSGPCSDNTGTCQTCTGPTTHYITVPPLFDPAITIDISGDNTPAVFTQALGDTCTLSGSDPGWYEKFHLNTCGVVTVDVCCTTPLMSPVWGVLVEACPNCSNVIGADQNQNGAQSGFGAGCNNNHCCPDGNFSAQFTLAAGTYMYQPYGDPTCEGTLDNCITNDDCPLGAVCEATVGPYTVHITVDPCNPAACCIGGTCQVLNRLDCEAAGGFWLGALDPAVADCFPLPNGACGTGSCCTGPGVCNDTTFFDTEAECLNANPNNIFVGGSQCLRDDPCPICTFDDDAHCKSFINANVRYISPSDRSLDPPIRWADDFTPQGSLLDAVCWWPAYFDPFNGVECAANPPPDDWRVRVYEDDFGLPGLEKGPAGGQVLNVFAKRLIPGLRVWEYTGAFQTPLVVTPGSCLWVEITGLGEGTGCTTYLTESAGDGNGYAVQDGDGTYGPEDIIIYNEGTIDDIGDYSFCVSTGLGTDNDCGDVTVPCCLCGTGCSMMSATACRNADGYIFAGEPSCATVTCPTVPANNACGSATAICTGQSACSVGLDNRCATNDGLVTTCNPVTGAGPANDFIQDVWFQYTPPCSGEMQIDTCSNLTMYDTMIAIYGGTATTCSCPPAGTDTGLITRPNPSPPPPTLPACDDNNGSEAAGTACPPNNFGRSLLKIDATGGNCYLIRVGGDRGSNVLKEGVAQLSINVTCSAINPPLPAPAPHNRKKNRYVSFNPNSGTTAVKFKVTRTFPPPTTEMGWVGPPDANGISAILPDAQKPASRVWGEAVIHAGDCEIYPVPDTANTPLTCSISGAPCAQLCGGGQCPAGQGECIAPPTTYEIRATSDNANFSPPLVVTTVPRPCPKKWGDSVGDFSGGAWTAPNGVSNVNDFVSALQCFQQLPTRPHVSICDVVGAGQLGLESCINKQGNIADVFNLIKAFQGSAYPAYVCSTSGHGCSNLGGACAAPGVGTCIIPGTGNCPACP
ncbi:MAG: hypothetical protein HY763_10515 [Planctomycetes bacterium]|nr:hypothetical protein [Planctomycetota bacterium]